MQITTIGLDIAKNVFQVHGIDATEKVVVRKQLRRSKVIAFFEALPPCLVGMEACASAHYWARETVGHDYTPLRAREGKNRGIGMVGENETVKTVDAACQADRQWPRRGD